MKKFISIGEYYNKPFVIIDKYKNIKEAKDNYISNYSDPVVMELSKFKKLYKEAQRKDK